MNIKLAPSPKIVAAQVTDAAEISLLIKNTAATKLRHEFSDEGWELFLQLLSEKTQRSLLKNKQFNYFLMVAEATTSTPRKILAVLAIKGRSHLFHLFVDNNSIGKGFGRSLWNYYLQSIKKNNLDSPTVTPKFTRITVNSSDYGIPFYENMGFVMSAGRQIKNGVCHTPMTYSI